MKTPLGYLKLEVEDGRLYGLHFVGAPVDDPQDETVRTAVRRYFDGEVDALDAIPVALSVSPFHRRVYETLRTVGAGTTITYGELAAECGAPGAARAVGTAMARNPVAIVVPCHRVLRSDGSIGGYGGGVEIKRWLLAHERARILGSQAV